VNTGGTRLPPTSGHNERSRGIPSQFSLLYPCAKTGQMLILHIPLISGAKCSFYEHPRPLVGLVTCDRPLVGSVAVTYWQVSVPWAYRELTVSVPWADRGSTVSWPSAYPQWESNYDPPVGYTNSRTFVQIASDTKTCHQQRSTALEDAHQNVS